MAHPNRSTDGSACDHEPGCTPEPTIASAPPTQPLDRSPDESGFTRSREAPSTEPGADDGYCRPAPFAWQHGRHLLLLDEEPNGLWVMAELWFDPDQCRYLELKRAVYPWAREALGATLSRALTHGDIIASESADRLDAWYGSTHGERVTAT
ncbi:MAG: hypothetical protein ACRDJH_15965 [Thermomicrobiales bacterium]